MSKWMETIHNYNIYDDFPIDKWPEDRQGWGFESSVFDAVIKSKPSVIIEVGSWKGASAIRMADLLKENKIDGEIICVDTWLGTADTWIIRDDVSLGRPREWGRPTVYSQFIANVIHSGHTDVIVPLCLDSLSAAQYLSLNSMQADAIYIDAGHDYDHCLQDIQVYWHLLRPGGIMFGDDYSMAWVGVIRAIHTFAEAKNLQLQLQFHGKWLIVK